MNQQIPMYPIYNVHYYDNNVKAYTTRRKKTTALFQSGRLI